MNIQFLEKCINIYGNSITLENLVMLLKKANYIDIYTDGATQFFRDPQNIKSGIRISGIGVYFGENSEYNISRLINVADNNECEIIACIEALKVVFEHRLSCFVNIFTDSRLVSDKMNGIIHSNKCSKLFDELIAITSKFIDVKYIYVKGHSDVEGNIKADELSRAKF